MSRLLLLSRGDPGDVEALSELLDAGDARRGPESVWTSVTTDWLRGSLKATLERSKAHHDCWEVVGDGKGPRVFR